MPSSFLLRRIFAVAILIMGGLGVLRASGRADGSDWGFSEGNLDRSCKPCDDFNQFAMGGWMKNNPIPAEYPNWGSFTMLADRNQASMRVILEEAAKANAAAGSNQQKIGDFYSSCMDTTAVDAAGVKPLAADFTAIDQVKDANGLQPLVARLQQTGSGYLFRLGSTQDLDESTQVIAEINQGGLGLPDRDYYTRTDEKSAQLRTDYVTHVAKMFVLAGDSEDKANAEAKTVMDLETALAKASMSLL